MKGLLWKALVVLMDCFAEMHNRNKVCPGRIVTFNMTCGIDEHWSESTLTNSRNEFLQDSETI